MADIAIRVATPDDLHVLSDLIAASYAMLADGSYEPEKLAKALPVMSRANPKLLASGTYFVAEANGEPAGCGGWTFETPGTGEIDEGIAHIRHFATHPAHLRKGIARQLLDRCLSEAAAAGAHTMKSRSTLQAEKFYASAGFRRIGIAEIEFVPGVRLSAVEMERDVP
ncbi:GNAT family N-acetyltransferase [Chelativorans salis]|uniref:GNAT family N-acetyltransferase n=1 Tax=Chelativorans salis TaxID=2978478 RepID=A0ABT2LIK9_9HYPH|nr:GNAT family N-acetyltransferase [Chelativorans sp. EGI FJ00035]MCT7374405.1 GNAT family N-acetyltransferase [Chelativorans sp. EGI FJ00035]